MSLYFDWLKFILDNVIDFCKLIEEYRKKERIERFYPVDRENLLFVYILEELFEARIKFLYL